MQRGDRNGFRAKKKKKRNAFVKRKKYKEFNRRQQKEMIYECPRMIMD